MEFNSAKIDEFQDIWVFCEQRDGILSETDFELISEARRLADERGAKLVGLLLGDNVEHLAKEIAGYGADKVIVCNHPLLKNYCHLRREGESLKTHSDWTGRCPAVPSTFCPARRLWNNDRLTSGMRINAVLCS